MVLYYNYFPNYAEVTGKAICRKPLLITGNGNVSVLKGVAVGKNSVIGTGSIAVSIIP